MFSEHPSEGGWEVGTVCVLEMEKLRLCGRDMPHGGCLEGGAGSIFSPQTLFTTDPALCSNRAYTHTLTYAHTPESPVVQGRASLPSNPARGPAQLKPMNSHRFQ